MTTTILSLIAIAAQPQGAPRRLTDFLQVLESGPTASRLAKGQGVPSKAVEIDSRVALKWDAQGLYGHIAELVQPASKGQVRSFADEVEALRTTAEILVGAQKQEVQLRLSEINAATVDPLKESTVGLAGAGGDTQDEQAKAMAAKQSMAEFRRMAVSRLKGGKGLAAAMLADIAASLDGDPSEGLGAFEVAAKDTAHEIRELLEGAVANAPNVMLTMSAHLVTPFGVAQQVHLEGYDKLVAGERKPFARNRLVMDPRTVQELLAAQEIFDSLNAYKAADLAKTASQAHQSVATAFERVSRRLNIGVLDQECEKLLKQLKVSGEEGVGPLLKDVRMLQALLQPLRASEIGQAPSQAEAIQLFAGLLNGLTKNLWAFVKESPSLLGRIAANLGSFSQAAPGTVQQDSIAFFRRMAQDFLQQFAQMNSTAQGLDAAIGKLVAALLLSERFSLEGKDLVAKTLKADEPIDTELDMQELSGSRRPGDKLVLRATLSEPEIKDGKPTGEPGKEIESGIQTLAVEAYGGYWMASGGMLLVDPRSKIERSLNWEPTVGLGYHYHVGMKGNDFWNSSFNPGIGLSFSMLDFNDDQRFELGIAASMTLLNDQIWIGYGRNLNAGANYFYLGFNPYTITKLFGRR
ncbi:MAG: hypothetical protein HZC36_15090 [Armatimonadetes bacterium]|nr:hypothetical protein [Armatimonadota bacterium]